MLTFDSAQALFASAFARLYPPDLLKNLQEQRKIDVNPGKNPSFQANISEAAEIFRRLAPEALGEPLVLDYSDESIHHLGNLLTLDTRKKLAGMKDPSGAPILTQFMLHGVFYMGETIRKTRGGEWLFREPLWESRVALTSAAGESELALFSWWLRALCDDEIGRGTLVERYRMHVETPTLDGATFKPFLTRTRPLPRLKKPTYDKFIKYLRAHLTELKDVGEDFPSPARFGELAFKFLEFRSLAEGRMLLLMGPDSSGSVHMFWLTHQGFYKAACYAADAFPDPVLKVQPDLLQLHYQLQEKPVMQEMLWWGP